jgi:NAD+ diphosphatase
VGDRSGDGLATPPRPGVDRDYLARARPELFDELAADPLTRVVPVWRGRTLLEPGDSPSPSHPNRRVVSASLRLLPPAESPDSALLVYLGRAVPHPDAPGTTPFVAAVLDDEAAFSLAPEADWVALREALPGLDPRDGGLLIEAVALANWHASHRFSPRTGQPLVAEQGGWVLRAADDTTEVFPRTDPAIIVAVVDEQDRLLLGSNAMWEVNRFSLLAGFVEPGESLEAAVAREVFEESGVRVIDPAYLGSQPWPFPSSLMVGFRALADPAGGWELRPDGAEILDLRWFTREELRETRSAGRTSTGAATDAGRPVILPGRASIARRIIDDWLALGERR